jgi:hypothetical protein
MTDYRAYAVQRLAALLLPQPPTPPKETPMVEHHHYVLISADELRCPLCGRRVRMAADDLFRFDILDAGDPTVAHIWGEPPQPVAADPPPAWLVGTLRDIERGVV